VAVGASFAMNTEDFDNELSSDDEDYCPGQQDSVSENSEPDFEEPNSDSDSFPKKQRKKGSKRRRARPPAHEIEEVAKEAPEVDPEEEKRKADALWAEFLGETDTKKDDTSKSAPATSSTTTKAAPLKPIIPTVKAPVVNIFEFAGETVSIPVKPTEQVKPLAATIRPQHHWHQLESNVRAAACPRCSTS